MCRVRAGTVMQLRRRRQTDVPTMRAAFDGNVRALRAGPTPAARWPEGPVCDTCYTSTLRRRGTCAGCGDTRTTRVTARAHRGPIVVTAQGWNPCTRAACAAVKTSSTNEADATGARLPDGPPELMAGPDGTVPDALVVVHDAMVASATPRKALNWVRRGAGAPILAGLAAGTIALTHDGLDAHPRPHAANHVRHMLVAHGVLPARDDGLAALERLNAETVAGIDRPEDRKVVAAFGDMAGPAPCPPPSKSRPDRPHRGSTRPRPSPQRRPVP